MLRERLDEVRERIAQAAIQAGRKPDDITLIAVTKKFPAAVMIQAYELGLRFFGENYVQEFEAKFSELAALAGAQFHLIGHLQSNKTKKAAELFQGIQTVDTPKLVRRLAETGAKLELMIEIKLSEEHTKSGVSADEISRIIDAAQESSTLSLTGFMTMPPWSDDAELSRPYFARLRSLSEKHGLPKLSMGMSHDLEVAIQEGATHVRVGTALFGPRPKPSATQ